MLPKTMTAIVAKEAGGPEVLAPVERPVPTPGSGEVLIKVEEAGINRPDVFQREGHYPPPKGAPDILGMDLSISTDDCGAPHLRGLSLGQI